MNDPVGGMGAKREGEPEWPSEVEILRNQISRLETYAEDMRQNAADWETYVTDVWGAKEKCLRELGELRAENDRLRAELANYKQRPRGLAQQAFGHVLD